ncbi:MAG: glycoside hydrolase family 5 protein [Clostridia bacterium]|nr:glycoside hydrolase family 5 protein [Clostridia bacterium]
MTFFKKGLKVLLILLGCIILFNIVLLVLSPFSDRITVRTPIAHKNDFSMAGLKMLPALRTEGNRIINEKGEVVLLRGVMAPDPDRLNERKLFDKAYYQKIKDMGANVLRVPVHPERYHDDPDYLWRYLDPIVTWAAEMNLYVIIDWHYIGNIKTGEGDEMPDLKEKPLDYSLAFWAKTAAYFKEAPHVIFELYNEPAKITSEDWTECAQKLIEAIRRTGADQLIIAGGIDYSHDLSWTERLPLRDSNLAYAAHVFPDRSHSTWQVYFGKVSEKIPVVATEWGFMDENRNQTKQYYLIGSTMDFGEPLLDFLSEKGIGWVAAWYDDKWEAPMFTNGYKALTGFGRFVEDRLK